MRDLRSRRPPRSRRDRCLARLAPLGFGPLRPDDRTLGCFLPLGRAPACALALALAFFALGGLAVWPRPAAAAAPQKPLGEQGKPRIELLLAGPGEDLFARFGHAALVVWPAGSFDRGEADEAIVFNYGYTDFGRRGLVLDFLRGEVRFWAIAQSLAETIYIYSLEDRSVTLLPLALEDKQAAALAESLMAGLDPARGGYTYHHFDDNCATRLRDLVDEVAAGGLRAQLEGRPTGSTFRDLVRAGFAGRLEILLLAELLLGRPLDRQVDLWQGAFLPRLLADGFVAAELRPRVKLASGTHQVYRRAARSPLDHDPLAGVKIVWSLGAGAGLLAAALVLAARRRSRLSGLPLSALALLTGCCGALIWSVALISTQPELRHNELALLFWPTDIALLGVAWRWGRGSLAAGRWLRGYALLRLAVVGLAAIGHAGGLLLQQPRAWLLLAAAAMLGIFFAARALPRPLAMRRSELAAGDGVVTGDAAAAGDGVVTGDGAAAGGGLAPGPEPHQDQAGV